MQEQDNRTALIKIESKKRAFGNRLGKLQVFCNDKAVTEEFYFGDAIEFVIPAGETYIKVVYRAWIFTSTSDQLLLELKPGVAEIISVDFNELNNGLKITPSSPPISTDVNYIPILLTIGFILMLAYKIFRHF